jgi:hypothetical protein
MYKHTLPVHVCAGHVLLSKCNDCSHVYVKLFKCLFILYTSTVSVHVCTGHVQFSKCKDCAHMCVYTMLIILIYKYTAPAHVYAGHVCFLLNIMTVLMCVPIYSA